MKKRKNNKIHTIIAPPTTILPKLAIAMDGLILIISMLGIIYIPAIFSKIMFGFLFGFNLFLLIKSSKLYLKTVYLIKIIKNYNKQIKNYNKQYCKKK